MVDLSTEYLGLKLANPVVPSASPLSRSLDTAKRLEDAGASALVMYSLFEEDVERSEASISDYLHHHETGYAEMVGYPGDVHDFSTLADDYLGQVFALKQALDIPIIASLNGVTPGGWVEYGSMLQESGADALELNIYYVAASPDQSSDVIEQLYIDIVTEMRHQISMPLTVKLFSQFSALPHFVRRLEQAGANGVALFNRFFQPDIDLRNLSVVPTLALSSSKELLLRSHWIAMLYGRVNVSLAVTGGVHTSEDALKAVLAGADVTHLCSALLRRGPDAVTEVLKGIQQWLEAHDYASLEEIKGLLSQKDVPDPKVYERANYVHLLQNYARQVKSGKG